MNNQERYDVIVLGAGLTGLVTAFYLKKSDKRILVIEKKDRWSN